MLLAPFRSSQIRFEVQKIIMKITSKFVNKASDWPLKRKKPIKCSVYKPFCESHYAPLNFAMNLRTSKRGPEHSGEKLAEIDCNIPFEMANTQLVRNMLGQLT